MPNEAWSLNKNPASQLEAALAAAGTAHWQLENFFHDANPTNYLAHDTYTSDIRNLAKAQDLIEQAAKILAQLQAIDDRVAIPVILETLPVVAMLKPCAPSPIYMANYRQALDALDQNS